MSGGELDGLGRVAPCGLHVGVHCRVDDAAGARLSTREEDELRLVEDALGGGYFHRVSHCADPIHRSAFGIKIIFKVYLDAHSEGGRVEPAAGNPEIVDVEFDADETAVGLDASDGGCAHAHEGVEDEGVFVGGGEDAALDEGDGFLGGMFAKGLLGVLRSRHGPNGLHLFAGDGFHGLVVEEVLALVALGGPEDGFGGVGEVAAGEVGRRVGFLPCDVVEDFEAELLHGVADGEDDVVCAGDPEGAVGLEDALAAAEPFGVEVVVFLRALRLVPGALVHLDHAAGVASDAAVGEEVRRVGEDGVEAAVGMACGDGIEEGEAVALVEEDAAVVVAVGAVERGKGVLIHDDTIERAAGRFGSYALRLGSVGDVFLGLSWHGGSDRSAS